MKIYVFGNPLVKKDSLPLLLLPKLKNQFPNINFIVTDPNENFPPKNEKDIIIIDTVLGIKEPILLNFDSLEDYKKTPISPHDYDLLMHLLLLKKLKKINNVKIIGIPQNFIQKQALKFISILLSKNGQRRTYKDQMHGSMLQFQ